MRKSERDVEVKKWDGKRSDDKKDWMLKDGKECEGSCATHRKT